MQIIPIGEQSNATNIACQPAGNFFSFKKAERPLGSSSSGRTNAPVGEITEKTEEDSRSNRRPIELIGSPARQRSQISDR
jgi:hypothetical protein